MEIKKQLGEMDNKFVQVIIKNGFIIEEEKQFFKEISDLENISDGT